MVGMIGIIAQLRSYSTIKLLLIIYCCIIITLLLYVNISSIVNGSVILLILRVLSLPITINTTVIAGSKAHHRMLVTKSCLIMKT